MQERLFDQLDSNPDAFISVLKSLYGSAKGMGLNVQVRLGQDEEYPDEPGVVLGWSWPEDDDDEDDYFDYDGNDDFDYDGDD